MSLEELFGFRRHEIVGKAMDGRLDIIRSRTEDDTGIVPNQENLVKPSCESFIVEGILNSRGVDTSC